jgi:hypothetical protein
LGEGEYAKLERQPSAWPQAFGREAKKKPPERGGFDLEGGFRLEEDHAANLEDIQIAKVRLNFVTVENSGVSIEADAPGAYGV